MKNYKLAVPLSISLLFLSSFLSLKFLDYSNTEFLLYLSITFCFSVLLLNFHAFTLKRNINQTIDIIDLLVSTAYLYIFLRTYYDEKHTLQNDYFVCSTLIFACFFLIKKYLFKDKWSRTTFRKSQIIFIVILLSGFVQTLYGFLQLTGIIKNSYISTLPSGFFNNPGVYANYITSILPLSLGCFFAYKSNYSKIDDFIKYFSLVTAIGIISILPFTNARAAWVSSAVGVMFVLIEGFIFLKKSLIIWIRLPLSILFVLLISVFICITLYNFKSQSAQGRLLIWKISLTMFKDNPMLGVGFDSFKGAYNNYQAEYFISQGSAIEKKVSGNILYAFNEFIQLLTELGLIGVILFLIVIFMILFKHQTYKKDFKLIGIKASVISILVTSLFSYPLHTIPIAINFMFFIVILSLNRPTVFTYSISSYLIKPLSIIIFFTITLFSIKIYKVFNGYNIWKEAAFYANANSYTKANALYTSIYPLMKHNEYFLYNYGCELSVMKYYDRSIEILEKIKYKLPSPELYLYLGNNYTAKRQFNIAEIYYKHACSMIPNLFYPKYTLAKFYQDRNRSSEMLKVAKEIVEMDVNIESIKVTQIKWEMEEILKSYPINE